MRHAPGYVWPYVGELFEDEELHTRPGRCRRARPPSLRAALDEEFGAVLHGRRTGGPAPSRSRWPAAAAASTPNTWATCWPRCRCWPASTPAPPGDAKDTDATMTATDHRSRAWDIAATRHATPRSRCSPSRTSGAARRGTADGRHRRSSTITPTYSGCPAMDAIREDLGHASSTPPATTRSGCDLVLAPAWTTDWMTRPARPSSKPTASPRPRAPASRGPGPAGPGREVPAVRLAQHQGTLPLRLHLLQGAVRHARTAWNPSTTSRCSHDRHDCLPARRRRHRSARSRAAAGPPSTP